MAMTRGAAPPTRERILSAAQRLFAERGYERVSMPAIAKDAGITAGAIYKHFGSKAELFFVVVRQAVLATASATSGASGGGEREATLATSV
jgi:AcrR family transcriptional regulator